MNIVPDGRRVRAILDDRQVREILTIIPDDRQAREMLTIPQDGRPPVTSLPRKHRIPRVIFLPTEHVATHVMLPP
jgi:hypothetical protein